MAVFGSRLNQLGECKRQRRGNVAAVMDLRVARSSRDETRTILGFFFN
jgi:hypothetical protein